MDHDQLRVDSSPQTHLLPLPPVYETSSSVGSSPPAYPVDPFPLSSPNSRGDCGSVAGPRQSPPPATNRQTARATRTPSDLTEKALINGDWSRAFPNSCRSEENTHLDFVQLLILTPPSPRRRYSIPTVVEPSDSTKFVFYSSKLSPHRLRSPIVLWTLEIHQGLARCLQAFRQGSLGFDRRRGASSCPQTVRI